MSEDTSAARSRHDEEVWRRGAARGPGELIEALQREASLREHPLHKFVRQDAANKLAKKRHNRPSTANGSDMPSNDPLFQPFEARPDECQAVYLSYDNIDRIARYYAESGYNATVIREKDNPTRLIVQHGEDSAVVALVDSVLVYGHPPTVMDPVDFRRLWRTAREER